MLAKDSSRMQDGYIAIVGGRKGFIGSCFITNPNTLILFHGPLGNEEQSQGEA